MTTSIQYLEAAKIEEVASQLRGEGYEVTISPIGQDEDYDIVASKGDRKLAVEVKVNSQLRDSAASIKTLRRRALDHGYDEFRLVVVNPPREVKISIEKLEEELFNYIRPNLRTILAGPSSLTLAELGLPEVHDIRLIRIGEIEIDSIDITTDGVQVVGNGAAELEIDSWELQEDRFWSAGFPPQDNKSLTTWKTGVPFAFNVILNHDLTISKALKIEVDTSSISG